MKSTTWRDIAELIGIAAIVASLVFVGLELRQTKTALLTSTYQARAFDAMNASRDLADSQYIGPLLAKIDWDDARPLDGLDSEETWRVRQFLISRLIDLDNEYFQYQNGMLDDKFFEGQFKSSLAINAKRWRAVGLTEFRAEFGELVDDVLAEDSTE